MHTVLNPTTQETTPLQKPSQTVSRIINPTIGGQFNFIQSPSQSSQTV